MVANDSRIFFKALSDSYSNNVPAVLSSAKPSHFAVSKADSFLNFGSVLSVSGGGPKKCSTASGIKGRAMK
jgi:hypothetical protein